MELNQYSPKQRYALFAFTGTPAIIIILLYLGVIPWTPPKSCRAVFCDPYHWQLLAIGFAFFCAGLSLIIPAKWRKLTAINAIVLVAGFLAGVVGSFFFR